MAFHGIFQGWSSGEDHKFRVLEILKSRNIGISTRSHQTFPMFARRNPKIAGAEDPEKTCANPFFNCHSDPIRPTPQIAKSIKFRKMLLPSPQIIPILHHGGSQLLAYNYLLLHPSVFSR